MRFLAFPFLLLGVKFMFVFVLQILIYRGYSLLRTAQAAWASAFEKAEQNNRFGLS